MPATTIAFALTVTLYFIALHANIASEIVAAIKVAPMGVLLVAPALDEDVEFNRERRFLAVGQIFCSFGDIMLEVHVGDREVNLRHFLIGLIAFAFGHLFYMAAFMQGGIQLRLVTMALVGGYASAVVYVLHPYLPEPLVLPVVVYSNIIAGMTALAISRVPKSYNLREPGAPEAYVSGALGAASFMVSDTILAVRRFAWRFPGGKDLVMLTYYLGQLGIAYSAWPS